MIALNLFCALRGADRAKSSSRLVVWPICVPVSEVHLAIKSGEMLRLFSALGNYG
jgi:hypothetical protein